MTSAVDMHRHSRTLDEERGSSPVEFILVGTLLTLLTLGALQLGFAIYVRNVVHDAAVEGAHVAALSGATLQDGVTRAQQSISGAVGKSYANEVTAELINEAGAPVVKIRITATSPLFGLLGPERGMEVEAHAPQEIFDPAG